MCPGRKKVKFPVFLSGLYAVPLLDNFLAACTGCRKKVVFAIIHNQNLPNQFPSFDGEHFPRPFGKKMHFGLISYIFQLSQKSHTPIWNGKCNGIMGIDRNQGNRCSGLCQTTGLVYKTIAWAAVATPTPTEALILQPTLRRAESSRTHVRSTF